MRNRLALVALISMLANGVCAHEAGDFFVRVGAAMVDPDSSSDGVAIPALGVPAIPGTELDVDDDTQLGLTLTYMFTDNIGLELLAASPFKHDITANLDGFAEGLSVPVGDVKHLPPTLSVVYYPLSGISNGWQPYIGLGVNYTYFFDESVDPDLESLTGFLAQEIGNVGDGSPVALSLDVDASFGIAAEAGFDLPLNDSWHVNASVRWIDIDTEASIESALGETITVESIHIDPWVYQLNLGFKF
jgi:outer membrane protein